MKYDLFSGKKWIVSILAAMILLGIILSSCGSDTKQDSSAIPDPSDDISSIAQVDEDSKPGHADDPIDRLAGVFYIDGDTSASCVEINSDGSFTAYYASGNVEQTGYVRFEEDNTNQNSKFYVYVFYTDEGNPYMGFVYGGEEHIDQFETGNGGGVIYQRVNP